MRVERRLSLLVRNTTSVHASEEQVIGRPAE